jgi:hypothetical protein
MRESMKVTGACLKVEPLLDIINCQQSWKICWCIRLPTFQGSLNFEVTCDLDKMIPLVAKLDVQIQKSVAKTD